MTFVGCCAAPRATCCWKQPIQPSLVPLALLGPGTLGTPAHCWGRRSLPSRPWADSQTPNFTIIFEFEKSHHRGSSTRIYQPLGPYYLGNPPASSSSTSSSEPGPIIIPNTHKATPALPRGTGFKSTVNSSRPDRCRNPGSAINDARGGSDGLSSASCFLHAILDRHVHQRSKVTLLER